MGDREYGRYRIWEIENMGDRWQKTNFNCFLRIYNLNKRNIVTYMYICTYILIGNIGNFSYLKYF